MSTIEEVVTKIRKLLALSKSENVNEAALAAAKAAKIMEDYQISEAALLTEPEKDEPVGSFPFEKAGKKVHWRMAVASGCAATCNCKTYWYGAQITLIGREADVKAARYLYDLILPQVENLAEECFEAQAPWEDKRRWMHAFRLGCAATIKNRLYVQHKETVTNLRKQAQSGILLSDGGSSSTALVVVDRRLARVENFEKSLQLRRGRGPSMSSRDGYTVGREAGNRVNLGGAARGSLRGA